MPRAHGLYPVKDPMLNKLRQTSVQSQLRLGPRIVFGVVLCLLALLAVKSTYGAVAAGDFGFLWQPTNWAIAFSVLPYESTDPYWWAFVAGLCNTALVGSVAIVLAIGIGFVVGLFRLSRNALLADLTHVYVNVIRNVPVILQAMFWYAVMLHLPPSRTALTFGDVVFLSNTGLHIPWFANPAAAAAILVLAAVAVLTGLLALSRRGRRAGFILIAAAALIGAMALSWRSPDALAIAWTARAGLGFRGGIGVPGELAALLAAITFYRSAFIAEVFRGGFKSVSREQIDAAHSLSLPPWLTLVKVRIPLALVSIVPALGSECVIMMKITSIGIVVGFMDLFAVGSNSSIQTGRPIEVLAVMILCYVVLNYSIVTVVHAMNRRIQIPGMGHG
jgi:His/Glu/Gln/Arg/opine family amino acid ABC transporter permease subunit